MRVKPILAALLGAALLSASACTSYDIPDETPAAAPDDAANPFQEAQDDTSLMAMLSHEAVNPPLSDNGEREPFPYDGGEFRLDYHFSVTGDLDSVGFLLFLDGKPQPYRTDGQSSDYAYCHTFDAAEDQEVSFLFEPVSGKAGDTLNLTIVSITNPDFQPDMESTSSYGWYHNALPVSMEMSFSADPPSAAAAAPGPAEALSSCSVREEKATAQYVEEDLAQAGWPDITMDTLDDGVYYTLTLGGDTVFDNLTVDEPVPVRFTLCGTPGARYDISFFLNHQPVAMNGETSSAVTLSKGGVAVVEGVIDPSLLGKLSTFYCVAVPAENTNTPFYKTNSILLFQEA
ncbi:hypothetical protein [Parvibacter caecicola]|uniref:Lipoprotein n=1 Tax=Parvibacter caecicola TaxID=747645 RepID=A0A3N0A9L6_9ACTN|nr:hypothetical protein [Parvibacter caecicola]MBB3171616.1 hypothetical protein [Parvibacter caecicola]MCR2040876.1 hypothetical protein [Parvibacter caecicola]RNL10695.1 hypothetical protein DMP11_06475 [Parvibacter caecicola]TJW10266.1 hypothetical protein E5982_06835 [Parvibacter caecicola]